MDRKSSHRHQRTPIIVIVLVTCLTIQSFYASVSAEESLGVQVPAGFEVTLFADDDLAHDIYSMTVDSFGRVVVSGKGYVRFLIDTDQDGKADTFKTFVNGPSSGAQGLYFAGRDLLCAGDGGLIRYKDRDGDDIADGPPDVFWKVKTGGEHDLHAMRKGPDGWWYIIAGNFAGITDKYVTLETSPVKKPEAGVILRLKPDLSGSEVYAHGFRNAYDFDFGAYGDLFSFDSDGERDISLPWYRPTRVFQVLPGSHQGWLTRSWKRPGTYFDMPPVVGAFGRGSPTGVECYRHTQFPEPYRNAMFVLDWTYGRVIALPMTRNGSVWGSQPVEFMTAVGQHGFAPTDLTIGQDGSLYVSVGGRGTRGGVYRISAKQPAAGSAKPLYGSTTPKSREEKIDQCLRAPQPLSSWSRRIWEPLVDELTSEPFINAALDSQRSLDERIRAIEILTEKFNGLDGDTVYALSAAPEPLIRARVAWSLGRTETRQPNFRDLGPLLEDKDPLVVRFAMEALQGAESTIFPDYKTSLGNALGLTDRYVRQTAMRLLTLMDAETFREMATVGFKTGWAASTPVAAAYALKAGGVQNYPVDIALRVLKADRGTTLKLEAVRVLQMGLGDLVPGKDGVAAVYDGYASPEDLGKNSSMIKMIDDALEEIYPSGNRLLDAELERVLAMIESTNSNSFSKIVARLTDESDPVEDIHRLIVASRMAVKRTPEQSKLIAKTLVNLEPKIVARELRQDSNWADRTMEMYQGLVAKDAQLPVAILETPGFGLPGHVQFISEFPPERFDDAIVAFSKRAQNDPDYEWNADVILLLAESLNESDQQLIRSKFDDFSTRNAVIMALSVDPQEKDRSYFYRALESAPLEIMQECITALGLLPPSENADENVALVRTLRRMGFVEDERLVRDQIVELLRRNLKQQFGYRFGENGNAQQEIIEQWTQAVQTRFPAQFAAVAGNQEASLGELKSRLAGINWSTGDEQAGAQLFKSRACAQCHGGKSALGPDLSGVAGRFSHDDLFTAIVFPNQDVSPRYQTTQVVTTDGQVRTGLVVYESVDGMVLRDSNNQTYRIESKDIEVKRRRNQSLMPAGLLKDLSDQDLANLYAYLRSLGKRRTATADAGND